MFSEVRLNNLEKFFDSSFNCSASVSKFTGEGWLSQSLLQNSFRKDINFLKDNGLLQSIAPELFLLQSFPAGPYEYHKEGSALEHTIRVVEASETVAIEYNLSERERFLLKLGAVVHDLGKGVPQYKELPSHPKHTVRGKEIARRFVERLGFSEKVIKFCGYIARFHMRFTKLDNLRENTLIKTVSKLNRTINNGERIGVYLAEADSRGRIPSLETNVKSNITIIKAAVDTLETIDVNYIENKFDVIESEESNEYIDNLLTQERVLNLRQKL